MYLSVSEMALRVTVFELMMTEVDRAILLCVDRTWFYGVTCALAVQDAGSANGDEWEIVLTRFFATLG